MRNDPNRGHQNWQKYILQQKNVVAGENMPYAEKMTFLGKDVQTKVEWGRGITSKNHPRHKTWRQPGRNASFNDLLVIQLVRVLYVLYDYSTKD